MSYEEHLATEGTVIRATPTTDQVERAAHAAAKRQEECKLYKRKHRVPESWKEGTDPKASLAEVLVADWLGLGWHQYDWGKMSGKADVGSNVEVRWTPYKPGHLIVQQVDKPERIYVLVRGDQTTGIELVGWKVGYHCLATWLDGERAGQMIYPTQQIQNGAAWVPAEALWSMALLPSVARA
jgi:hypothetical protein